MIARIEVAVRLAFDDPRGAAVAEQARSFLGVPVGEVRTRAVYKLSCDLSARELEEVRQAIADPVLEEAAVGQLPLPSDLDWVLAVGFRPGVTDNLARTARVFIADVIGRELPAEDWVATETLYLLRGPTLEEHAVQRLGRELLANELVQTVRIWTARAYQQTPLDLALPTAGSTTVAAEARAVPLPATDEELHALSEQRTLSLSLAELQAIRAHFADANVQQRRQILRLPRDPTDVELEAIAQTWSEHCKHKIFNARIRYRDEQGRVEHINGLFGSCIKDVTRELAGRVDWLVSVFEDNAGVVRFSPELHLVYKVETHNSPSALDPYGGAMTGIVGVNRDPLGTGMGATLLANVWGYCLASPFHDGPTPAGLLHPHRVREGVHQGVIDGGNQSGIPYCRGFELFDLRFLGKPLVFCGTVGLMPATVHGHASHEKKIVAGDCVVMVGGRIGKDGIHGATFSSEALHAESPAQAVQIGDPITQKKMSDFLHEARDRGLYRALTDNGAGGLSSSVGELAQLCGGAELDLARAPLKYPGLQPWEILLSEAQERMTLAVAPAQLEELLALAQRREVEATVLGHFTDSGVFRLRYGEDIVGELHMSFLHDGCPRMELEAEWRPPVHLEPAQVGLDLSTLDAGTLLEELLASLEICSKEAKWRQYDHEVKGLSVIKPLVGVYGDIPAGCTALRVDHAVPGAVLLAEGIAPRLSDIDAGAMAAYVVDLAVRRIVAGGGRLGQIAGLDNFCWPDPVQSPSTPDGRFKLAQLVRACRALAEMCRGLELPCISGKDSMKNDSTRGGVKISIPPTLLFSALGWLADERRATELTATAAGELLYVVGMTRGELGGSALFALLAARHRQPELIGNQAPQFTPAETREVCAAMTAVMDQQLVSAVHAPHQGGLAVGLAMLCLAADLGLEVALDGVPRGAPSGAPDGALGDAELSATELLFAEGGSRFLVVVPPERAARFEALLAERSDVPWAKLGSFASAPSLHVQLHGQTVIARPLAQLRTRFKEALDVL